MLVFLLLEALGLDQSHIPTFWLTVGRGSSCVGVAIGQFEEMLQGRLKAVFELVSIISCTAKGHGSFMETEKDNVVIISYPPSIWPYGIPS